MPDLLGLFRTQPSVGDLVGMRMVVEGAFRGQRLPSEVSEAVTELWNLLKFWEKCLSVFDGIARDECLHPKDGPLPAGSELEGLADARRDLST